DGTVECDAAVMHSGGPDDRPVRSHAGAVACVGTSRHPVHLAKRVLDETPHVFLVGAGAEALEPDPIDPARLITQGARDGLDRWRKPAEAADGALGAHVANGPTPEGSATCGAVAIDAEGRLAAATSTGGVIGQWPGRVGDAPIVGAGTWADRRVAISATGRGEAFLRAATARALAGDVADAPYPVPPDRLSDRVRARLAEVRAHDGEGGLIVVTEDGTICVGFDTPQMAYGWRRRRPDGGSEGDARVGDVAEVWDVAPTR
ncbi:MAG: isoaspartyl peptidase/L-asparaginase, partial [Trueperaceae bacterium]